MEDLDSTFGVLFVGFMFSSAFYGCMFFQTYVFYTRYPNEDAYTKGVVALLSTADTVATGLISHTMYQYLINDFTVSFDQLNVLRTFTTAFALTNTEILLVQLFYVYRTWSLNKRRPFLPAVMSAFSISSFVFAVAAAVQMSEQTLFIDIVGSKVEILAGLNEGLATLCSIMIVCSQYYYLRPSRQPGMKASDDWFDIGVLHLLSRGTVFMIMQLVLLLTLLAIPHHFVWVCFHFIIGKVYTNSLLAMLNSRTPFRGRGLNEEESLNTRSRSTGVGASVIGSNSTPLSGSESGSGHRKSPGSPGLSLSHLQIDSKGGRSVATELDVMPSSAGDDSSKKSMLNADEDPYSSTPELTLKPTVVEDTWVNTANPPSTDRAVA
ncbi:hypothetical protein EIP91_008676 [Steccherinum ochraceum]|uniref:DUF6534 domain-containing protein n=1 Tax=Steccherinum ochraceum TaxID=92696 RepID=A0A4R0R2I4_9APHY|nr:hypothetical protein EIP91_008676 [Steccherinum ochraceum]